MDEAEEEAPALLAPTRRHASKGPGPAAPLEKPQATQAPRKREKATTSDDFGEKVKAAVSSARQALTGLNMVNPASVWKNLFKDAEITAKIKKASQAETAMTKLSVVVEASKDKQELESMIQKIRSKISGLGPLQDTVGVLRGSKQVVDNLMNAEFAAKLISASEDMDPETLSTMLVHVGHKVAEDRMQSVRVHRFVVRVFSSQERGSCFFPYAGLTEDATIFTLGSLWNKSDAMDKVLLRTQLTLVHDWMDGFKAAPMAKIEKSAKKIRNYLDFAMEVGIFRRGRCAAVLSIAPESCCRTGVAHGDLSLSGAKPEHFENELGYSIQALVDLQKLLCCISVVDAEVNGSCVNNALRCYFKEAVACTDYSSRVTLAVRQGAAWKRRGRNFPSRWVASFQGRFRFNRCLSQAAVVQSGDGSEEGR